MEKLICKIRDLSLWDENPRLPEEYFNKSEGELIEYLFNKKGEKEKIIELAKSIIENFDIVSWERLIVWDKRYRFKKDISYFGYVHEINIRGRWKGIF